MLNNRNQREVENRLREQLKVDRARVQVGKISRFGLLEMSRQRLRPSLGESSHIPCPRCDGQGTIRDTESLALSILRILEEEATKDLTAKVIAELPVETATFLLNEKRKPISEIEHRHDIEIVIVPNPNLDTPQYHVQRIRLAESSGSTQTNQPSYKLPTQVEEDSQNEIINKRRQSGEEPAIKQIIPDKPAPGKKSIISKIFESISDVFKNIFRSSNKSGKTRRSRRNQGPQRRRRQNRRRGSSRSGPGNRDQSARRQQAGDRRSNKGNNRPSGKRNRNRSSKNYQRNPDHYQQQGRDTNVKNEQETNPQKATDAAQNYSQSPEQQEPVTNTGNIQKHTEPDFGFKKEVSDNIQGSNTSDDFDLTDRDEDITAINPNTNTQAELGSSEGANQPGEVEQSEVDSR